MEGDWVCAVLKWDQQQCCHSCSEFALVSIYFSSGISSALFLRKFVTQWRISLRPLCPWPSGCLEELVFFSLELHAELCVDS